MVLGISPVTGARLDALADGILSRPVTRYEYLLASWLARVLVVLARVPGRDGAGHPADRVCQAAGARQTA